MKIATYLKWMRRESRGSRGRMIYFAACLAIGVAAVVGIASLSESVEHSFRSRSREILGADFTVDARRPLPPLLDEKIADLGIEGLERADRFETASMIARMEGGQRVSRSRLALLKAVAGRYPLYGDVVTDPPGGIAAHLRDDTVIVESALLKSIDAKPGDTLRVGTKDFTVAAALVEEPGRPGFTMFLGAPVYLTRKGFEGSGLLGFGSRVRYKALFALPGARSEPELKRIIKRLKDDVPGAAYLDFDTHFNVGPVGRRATERINAFLGLVALLSLVVGGIGVSQIVRAWLAGRTQAIAVMRCIGMRPAQILVLSLGHTALLALAGSLAGAVLGAGVPYAVLAAEPEMFAGGTIVLPLSGILRGVGLGVGLALAFSVPPLTAIWRVSPARVLRADADPLPPNPLITAAAGAVVLFGVLAAAWVQANAFLPAAAFTGGFAVLGLVLFAGARLLMKLAGRLPRARLNPYLKHGFAALARPGAGTTGAVVALGLGTMVVTAMWIVETRLREGILGEIPEDAPSVFVIDIQPGQWEGVRGQLEAVGARGIDQVPVVTARISSIDGVGIDDLAKRAKDQGWSRRSLTREQRLTWRETLTKDNELVEGELWSDPAVAELSVEKRFAERLHLKIGSEVEFDVQGVPLSYRVTSIRSVEWQSFSINFFLVVEPGTLDKAPALYLANANVPPESEQDLQDKLTTTFPNLTVLRVRPILEQVLGLLQRIALGIRVLGSFTVAAGLAILAGAVSATALRRGGEVALLKTLGITRGGVTALFFAEYGLCGAVAGAVGASGALLLAWAYLDRVAELDVSIPLLALPIATVACGLLTAVCGIAASARSLTVRPIEALR
ncbi:MAG: ABC transporter permease [Planctomycetota bacterium]